MKSLFEITLRSAIASEIYGIPSQFLGDDNWNACDREQRQAIDTIVKKLDRIMRLNEICHACKGKDPEGCAYC